MARGHETAKHSVTMTDAVAFIRNIDAHMAENVAHVRKYADSVMAEIRQFDTMRESDPRSHAQAAVLFGILSPQLKFSKNVAASWRMMRHLYATTDTTVVSYPKGTAEAPLPEGPRGYGTYCVAIFDVLTDDGRDNFLTAKPASVKIAESLQYLRNLDGEDMTLERMRQAVKDGAVRGLADKTMRMALALYDASLPVYTLDVHMLRGIQSSHGGTIAGEMTVTSAAYDAIEAAMVDWHTRNFPEYPTFVSQWALWNAWGFNEHQCHLGIFGLA